MKKTLTGLLAALMILGFAGCRSRTEYREDHLYNEPAPNTVVEPVVPGPVVR